VSATAVAAQPAEVLDERRVHHLLVPVDGAPITELALAAAVTAARRDNAKITLLAVVPDILGDARRWAAIQPGVPYPAHLQEEADTGAQRTLRDTVRRIPQDVPVSTVMRRGKAGPQIVAELAEHDYDAVMLGSTEAPTSAQPAIGPGDAGPWDGPGERARSTRLRQWSQPLARRSARTRSVTAATYR
jgi:nucleotide-binding universal stress UspA family protein